MFWRIDNGDVQFSSFKTTGKACINLIYNVRADKKHLKHTHIDNMW